MGTKTQLQTRLWGYERNREIHDASRTSSSTVWLSCSGGSFKGLTQSHRVPLNSF